MNVKCLNCGTVHNGNFCPNCGAPTMQAHPLPPPIYTNKKRMPTGVVIFLTISGIFAFGIIFLIFMSIVNSVVDEQNTVVPTINTTVTPIPTEAPIQYTVCDISTMIQELNDNALKAERKYTDQYIEITGKLSNIDSDGKYISIEPLDSEWSLDRILCDIQSEDQVDKIMQLSVGDTVTIKGKVTSIGEILGYAMDIDEIE